ncbi:DNA-processing protein DprA [Candidatus Saccharibacteria bacterium]|nr:DNA-processing protein DprA [Candidatus Saccharibacteria bacterium]
MKNVNKINQIRPQDTKFTEVLSTIALVPKKLYFVGKLPENSLKCVTIVGSRKPTRYGQEVAYSLAFELAKRGITIISGLALGIDAIAHRGALDAKGLTVAVLASGVDDITPRSNYSLGQEIIYSGGAIISEYEPGTPPYKGSFLERNRIVSGLSDAIVVVEAASRSGTLSTAAHALAQGKYVFAVPGNITSPMSTGCNRLIKQGAIPLTEVDDVLAAICPNELVQGKLDVLGDNEVESQIIKLIKKGERDGEAIMHLVGLNTSDFNQVVTLMELKGQIRSLGANQWALK